MGQGASRGGIANKGRRQCLANGITCLVCLECIIDWARFENLGHPSQPVRSDRLVSLE